MSRNDDSFAASYAFAFRRYLADPEETLLRAAYELGRKAVERELSVLDLAAAHHEALRSALASASPPRHLENVVSAAEDFFAESLGTFEMVQRGYREARELAAQEKRQTAIIRRLSSVLADTALALDTSGSLEEMLRFVAEQARELTEASHCAVTVTAAGDGVPVTAVAHTGADVSWRPELAWTELATVEAGQTADPGASPPHGRNADGNGPKRSLAASLTSLDGRELGRIEIADNVSGRGFSELDNALLVHLAQMVSAAVERARFHQREERG